jgi:two-component system response regulator HydG
VLITGETGTGKEVVAELIHGLSERASGPFIKVNCAALPETLLESELFGHERGAFTGADRQRIGRFEQATGGTLFLDEIGDMSAVTQAKLLRVLQDQEFHRLGGSRPLRTDARIVAATNQRLEDALREGRFREDLYFRLNVIGIHLPPLRERSEDAVALAQHFLAEFSRELLRPTRGFTDAAMERIRRSRWSGNVRELRNVVERCVLMSDGELIDASQIAVSAPLGEPEGGCLKIEFPPEGLSLDRMERELVLAALEQVGHVQKDAAKLLHVTRRKLNYMIGRMGLTHPSWRRNRLPVCGGE